MTTININSGPHQSKKIEIHDNSVHILVGKNGSGKSQLLMSLNKQLKDSIHLTAGFEGVSGVETVVNYDRLKRDQLESKSPHHVSSFVASDTTIRTIIEYYFQLLFGIKLDYVEGNFKTGNFPLSSDADGFKSIFNLIYYMVSPNKIVLLDEPERFLHPSLRPLFMSVLSVIATNYKKKFIIATHSPSLMRFDLDNVYSYQLRRNPDEIFALKHWLENLPGDTSTERENKQSFQNWFYYHSDIVFSSRVILLEGISDQIIMEALRQKLSYDLKIEDVCFKFIAQSTHESGGKTRLHKIQKLLESLVPTVCIADKDIITDGLEKWFTPLSGTNESQKIVMAKNHGLYILPVGELEDYYFTGSQYIYCKDIATARGNKIPAAYEQAQIIASTELSDIKTQYHDIFNILCDIAPQPADLKKYLISIAYNHFINVHVKKYPTTEHIQDKVTGNNVEILLNFMEKKEPIKISKKDLTDLDELIKKISGNIESKL